MIAWRRVPKSSLRSVHAPAGRRPRLRPTLAGAALLALLVGAATPAIGAAPPPSAPHSALSAAMLFNAGSTSPLAHRANRALRHTERMLDRFVSVLTDVWFFWFWLLRSSIVFAIIAALSSVTDRHVLSLRRAGPGMLSRYLGRGIRMFVGLVWDRSTPYLARSLLAGALLYWLLPSDLIPDTSRIVGVLDDLIITFSATRAFMYLCPDALLARHAAAVEWRTRRSQREAF